MRDRSRSSTHKSSPEGTAHKAAFLSAVFSLSVVLLAVVLILNRAEWNYLGLLLVSLTSVIASILALRFSRSGKAALALILLVFIVLFWGIILPLLFQGVAILLLLSLLIGILFLSGRNLTQAVFLRMLALAIIVYAITFLVDHLAIGSRPAVLSAFSESVVFGFLLIFSTALLLRQFSVSSILYKVVVSFLIITIFQVLVLGGYFLYSTRSLLINAGGQTLSSAATQVADVLDNFFSLNLSMVQVESELNIFREYLSLPVRERSSELIQDTRSMLELLAEKNRIEGGSNDWLGFVKGYILIDQTGSIVEATSAEWDGLNVGNLEFFQRTIKANQPCASSILFWEGDDPELLISAPINDPQAGLLGVLAIIFDGRVIQRLVQEANGLVGERSLAWVFDENTLLIAKGIASDDLFHAILTGDAMGLDQLRQQSRLPDGVVLNFQSKDLIDGTEAIRSRKDALFSFYDEFIGEGRSLKYLAAGTTLKTQPWTIIYSQQEQYFLGPVEAQSQTIQVLAGTLMVLIFVVAFGFARLITSPILTITEVARSVADGDLSARAQIKSQDEIGALASMINIMTAQLKRSLSEMEERVRQRTFELERRSRQLQLAADVGRAAATIHDLNELLERVSILISERFNHYHVGIYLIDEAGEYAVLRAANSEGGKRMLTAGYRLAIGHQGIVGHVAATGQARVVDVEKDADYMSHTDLPHTRSELAVPLISVGELLGVLDVHSMKPSAFSEDDLAVMQVLADLIAVAIENARLFEESKQALEATRRAYGEISHRAWLKRLRGQHLLAFRSQARSTQAIQPGDLPGKSAYPQQISVPIKVRDTVIGYVDTYKPLEQGYWTSEEEETLQKLADQIGIALESARLYENSQIQAERERLVGEFNTQLQASLDVDTVLKTAVQEIRKTLELSEVTVILSDNFLESVKFSEDHHDE